MTKSTKKTAKTRPKAKPTLKKARRARAGAKGGRPQSQALVMGVAESIRQACELIGWPESVFKQLKRAGAPGFRFSRVYFAELLPWIGKRGLENEDIDWSQALKKEQTLRERIRRAKDECTVIDRDEVREKSIRAVSLMLSTLDRVFKTELPASLKGLNENQIRARCDEEISRVTARLQESFARLAEKNGVPDHSEIETNQPKSNENSESEMDRH